MALSQGLPYDLSQKEVLVLNEKASLDFLNKNKSNVLTAKKSLEIFEYFKESNGKVAKEFLGRKDGVLFREKLRDKADDYPGLSYRAAFYISKELIRCVKEENECLNKRILTIEASLGFKGKIQDKTNLLLLSARKRQKSLNSKLIEQKSKNHVLESKLTNLQNSTSWKITKPLRAIKRYLQKFRKK